MNQSIETLLAYFVDGTDLGFDEYDVLVAAGLVEEIDIDGAAEMEAGLAAMDEPTDDSLAGGDAPMPDSTNGNAPIGDEVPELSGDELPAGDNQPDEASREIEKYKSYIHEKELSLPTE
jgi:hypothetical protein